MNAISEAFAGLKDIDEVDPLNAADAPCLQDIRDVLAKHGMLDRFGVTLLHSHFPVHEGESLVETCDAQARHLTMKPIPESEIANSSAVGTSWRLTEGAEVITAAKCIASCVVDSSTKQHNRKHAKYAG